MQKILKELMRNPKYRTGIIIGAISAFIMAVIIFIGIELLHNQTLFINNYVKEQQQLTDQVSIRLHYYMEAELLTPDEAIEKITGEVQTSGSSFWFIAKDNNLIFVKNKTTSGLFTYITLEAFIQDNQKDGMKITTGNFSLGNESYTIGICTTQEYIKETGQIFKHNVYILMPILLVTSILLVIFILGLLVLNRQENKIARLTAEAIDRNITIEQLTARMKKTRLNNLGSGGNKISDSSANKISDSSGNKSAGGAEKTIYSKDVLISLLDKVSRENIVPLTIVIIELTSRNSKIVAEDYERFIKSTSKLLSREHVLAEILPGIFTILLFHSALGGQEEIKRTLIHDWAIPLKKKGIKVRMGISCIEDYDSNVGNVFEIVYKEVSGMHQENQIKLSS